MLLDGSIVEKGDKVFHLTLGSGVVESVEKGTARIRMSNGGGIKNMADGGYSRGVKVFFWSKPLIFSPKKKDENTAKKEQLVNAIMEYIESE